MHGDQSVSLVWVVIYFDYSITTTKYTHTIYSSWLDCVVFLYDLCRTDWVSLCIDSEIQCLSILSQEARYGTSNELNVDNLCLRHVPTIALFLQWVALQGERRYRPRVSLILCFKSSSLSVNRIPIILWKNPHTVLLKSPHTVSWNSLPTFPLNSSWNVKRSSGRWWAHW